MPIGFSAHDVLVLLESIGMTGQAS